MLKMVWLKNEMGQLVPKWVVDTESHPLNYLLETTQPQPIHHVYHTTNRVTDLQETPTEDPVEWAPLGQHENIGMAAIVA